MKIGILGSGAVGVALANGFIKEGHTVWLATRDPSGEKGEQLSKELSAVTVCDFTTAAQTAELAVLCVKWDGAEEAVAAAGPENLAGKVVMETSNIIKPEGGVMTYSFPGKSAAEQVQAWLPKSQVVKAFNTIGAVNMYKPDFDGIKPTMLIAGDDAQAKHSIACIADQFGWESLDNGPLIASRELEAMALVWIRNTRASGEPHHAFKML